MKKPRVPLTLAETKQSLIEIRKAFEREVATGNPEAIEAKRRIDEAARRMRKVMRLPPGYEFFKRAGAR